MEWHDSIENLLKNIGEECQIKAKIHRMMFEHYSRRNLKYQIPVIILSVLSGSGNFIASNFPEYEKWLIIGIGGMSMFTSIISSISQFLKLSQLSEGHRIAYLSWEKFYSQIRIQMSLRRKDRMNAEDFYNVITMNYNRLNELSPDIEQQFITKMKSQTKKIHKTSKPYYLSKFKHIDKWDSKQKKHPDDKSIDTESTKTSINITPKKKEKLSNTLNRISSNIDTLLKKKEEIDEKKDLTIMINTPEKKDSSESV